MTTFRPLMVLYCFALPLISRRLGVESLAPPAPPVVPLPPLLPAGFAGSGTRKTWLARNSSAETVSATLEPGAASASREESSTSVVGTRMMWCWTGLHCEGRGLLKKAARNGFRGCIHSTGDLRRPLGRSPLACISMMARGTIGARRREVVRVRPGRARFGERARRSVSWSRPGWNRV